MKIARFQHAGAVHLGLVDTDSGMVTPLQDGPMSPEILEVCDFHRRCWPVS